VFFGTGNAAFFYVKRSLATAQVESSKPGARHVVPRSAPIDQLPGGIYGQQRCLLKNPRLFPPLAGS